MKKFILFLFSIYGISLFGQLGDLEVPIDTNYHRTKFKIINGMDEKFEIKILEKDTFPKMIQNVQFSFDDADLEFIAALNHRKRREKYYVNIKITDNENSILTINKSNQINTTIFLKGRKDNKSILLKNISEGVIFPNGIYRFETEVIKKRVWGIDCDNPPTFEWPQKWPYAASATVGSALLISSRVIRSSALDDRIDAESAQEGYITAWQNGQSEEIAEEAKIKNNNLFGDAIRKNRNQKGLFWAGTSLIASSIIGYFIHKNIYINRNNLYQKNKHQCNKEAYFQFEPFISNDQLLLNDQQIGLTLTYTF